MSLQSLRKITRQGSVRAGTVRGAENVQKKRDVDLTKYFNITKGKKTKLENRMVKKVKVVNISSSEESESKPEKEKSRNRSETPEIPMIATQALFRPLRHISWNGLGHRSER